MIDCRLQTWPYLLEMDVLNGHRREKKTHVTTEEMGDRRGKSSVGGIWTRKDKELLQKNVVDYLKSEPRIGSQVLTECDPLMRGLICSHPKEVYERYITYLSAMNLMCGLFVSGIAGPALAPMDIQLLDPSKKIYGEIYNVAAAITLAVTISTTFISGVGIMMVSTQLHDSSAVYRGLVGMSPYWGLFTFLFWVPLMGIVLIMVPCSQYIRNESDTAKLTGFYTPMILFIFLFVVVFLSCTTWGGEMAEWDYLALEGFWVNYFTRKNFKQDTTMINKSLLAHCQKGVLEAVADDAKFSHRNDDSTQNKNETLEEARAEEEMFSLLQSALPELAIRDAQARMRAIGTSLLRSGLTVERLQEASGLPSGLQLIMSLLREHSELTEGQVLALVSKLAVLNRERSV